MATVWLKREDCVSGSLPGLCLRCGEPTTERRNVCLRGPLVWNNPFWLVARPNDRVKILAPICPRHRHHWRNRQIAVFAILGGLWVATAVLIGMEDWVADMRRFDAIVEAVLPVAWVGVPFGV